MALSQSPEPFVWGTGGAQLTPEEIARRREIADAMLSQGGDYSPVQHWAQGLARLGKAVRGGLERHDADESERAARASAQEKWQPIVDAMIGAGMPAAPASQSSAPSTSAAPSPPASPPPVQAAPTPPAGPSPGVRRAADAMTQVASLDPSAGMAPSGGRIPAAIRANNPGAMWPGPSAARFGSTGYEALSDGQGNRIAKFDTPEAGAAA